MAGEANKEWPLWTAVAHYERQALMAWRQQHAGTLDLETALANHVTRIETMLTRRPGGNVLVTVSVLARKAFDSQVLTFRLQRAANKMYHLEPGTSTSSAGPDYEARL